MAELLDHYDFSIRDGSKYRWKKWLDGNTWKLTRHTDYHCHSTSILVQARVAAKKFGGLIRGQKINNEDGEFVIIQFYRPTE